MKETPQFRYVWRAMNLRFKFGLVLIVFFLLLGFLVPLFNSTDVMELSTYRRHLPPSVEHFLGTNGQGQDTFWLLVESVKNSLIIGILVATMATLVGVIMGLLAGFLGGIVDRAIMFVCDVIIVVPSLPILILIASLLKGGASIYVISAILIFFNWPWPARQARSMALTIREREFIHTAHFSGESVFKIIAQEIFPYVFSWATANFINTVLVAIGSESSLAVLGLSSSTTATLGNMIYWARNYQAILQERWLWIGTPVVATMLLFIGLFLTFNGYSEYMSTKRGR